MRVSGIYFDYRGKTYRQILRGDDWVTAQMGDAPESDFPDAIEFGVSRKHRWVQLPSATISNRRHETVRATWRGVAVTVDSHVTGSEVSLGYVGPPQMAKDLGMDGDQYMGWTVIAPADELERVSVDVTEL